VRALHDGTAARNFLTPTCSEVQSRLRPSPPQNGGFQAGNDFIRLSNVRKDDMTASHRFRLFLLGLVWVAAAAGVGAVGAGGGPGEKENVVIDPPVGSAKLLLSEDFESTPVGEVPRGFILQSSPWSGVSR
jgi:hypothetical protein